jgi:hypothetical protein
MAAQPHDTFNQAATANCQPDWLLSNVRCFSLSLQEPLLPTPTNVNPVHVSREDLVPLVRVQQWVQQHLNIKLPLLNGTFVLAPAQHSCSTRQLPQVTQQAAGIYDDTSSITAATAQAAAAAAALAVPWRLRQVSRVEVCPGDDPADATVVLVGGERVRAGAVKQGQLAEAQDHQVRH